MSRKSERKGNLILASHMKPELKRSSKNCKPTECLRWISVEIVVNMNIYREKERLSLQFVCLWEMNNCL